MKKEKGRFARVMREHFSAPRIAYMAVFTALAFVVTFLEFPIFPQQASFLKFDFANVFFMIEGFIFGPVEAVISIGIKELLCLTKSQTAGVGEVANFIMSTSYVIVPAIGYRFRKGKKWVVFFLAIGSALQIGVSLLVNRYINFPLYGMIVGFDPVATFAALWLFVVYFNLIKSIGISVVVFLMYKPLSRFIRATSEKFEKRMRRVKAESDTTAQLSDAQPAGETPSEKDHGQGAAAAHSD